MAIFLTLFYKILPLYFNIALGYIAAKTLDTSRDTIARIMWYIINPIIIFNGVLNVTLSKSILSLPLLTFTLSCCLCLFFYWLCRNIWEDSTRNLAAFSAGTANTGYFGIPLAIILFDNQGESVYILAILGLTLYENTLGYYILAKGTHPASECLTKLFKLPALYAFFGGLLLNPWIEEIPGVFLDFMVHIKGTFTVLGMMIIGLGLAGLQHFKVDKVFIGISFFAKFFVWPALMLGFCALDRLFFHIYTEDIHTALILLSVVPLAANSVILAALLKSQPEKAATSVLLGTIFGLFFVPLMVTWFIK